MAIGNSNTAKGTCSFAGGTSSAANGTVSFSFGSNCNVEGNYAGSIGARLEVSNNYEFATGYFNKSVTGTRFSVGIGNSETARKNAFEIKTDGKTYFLQGPNGVYLSGTNLTQTIKAVVLDAVQNDQQFRDALRAALNQ